MATSRMIGLRITPPIEAALSAWCKRHKTTISKLALRSMLKEIGRLDLLEEAPKMGRPRKPAVKKKRPS